MAINVTDALLENMRLGERKLLFHVLEQAIGRTPVDSDFKRLSKIHEVRHVGSPAESIDYSWYWIMLDDEIIGRMDMGIQNDWFKPDWNNAITITFTPIGVPRPTNK